MLISQSRYCPVYGTDKGKRMFCFSSVFLIPNVDFIFRHFVALYHSFIFYRWASPIVFIWHLFGTGLLLHNIIAFRNSLKGHYILTQGKALWIKDEKKHSPERVRWLLHSVYRMINSAMFRANTGCSEAPIFIYFRQSNILTLALKLHQKKTNHDYHANLQKLNYTPNPIIYHEIFYYRCISNLQYHRQDIVGV